MNWKNVGKFVLGAIFVSAVCGALGLPWYVSAVVGGIYGWNAANWWPVHEKEPT